MFKVVVTPPSSEPSSTTTSQVSSPRQSLLLPSSLSALSISPPHTNRAKIPSLSPNPSLPVTVSIEHADSCDTALLSSSAIAFAREANRNRRLGHTARPPADNPVTSSSSASIASSAEQSCVESGESTPSSSPSVPSSSSASPSSSPSSPSSPALSPTPMRLSLLPATPRSSLSRAARPAPLSSLLFPSPAPLSSPPSPRTLNSPSYRHPSKLFPTLHTDKRGFLLPPVANPDLPRTLEGPDSFWVEDAAARKAEAERQRLRGRRRTPPKDSESREEKEPEDGDVIDVVRVDDADDLHWDDVIDAVLHVGTALAKEKHRRVMQRHREAKPRRAQQRQSVTIEHVQHSADDERIAERAEPAAADAPVDR